MHLARLASGRVPVLQRGLWFMRLVGNALGPPVPARLANMREQSDLAAAIGGRPQGGPGQAEHRHRIHLVRPDSEWAMYPRAQRPWSRPCCGQGCGGRHFGVPPWKTALCRCCGGDASRGVMGGKS